MEKGKVTVRRETQVTDDGGNTKFVRAEQKTDCNGNKPAEGSLSGETGVKMA